MSLEYYNEKIYNEYAVKKQLWETASFSQYITHSYEYIKSLINTEKTVSNIFLL